MRSLTELNDPVATQQRSSTPTTTTQLPKVYPTNHPHPNPNPPTQITNPLPLDHKPMVDPWRPPNHNHKPISHKTINYPPQIQNNEPIHYPHKPIGANHPYPNLINKTKPNQPPFLSNLSHCGPWKEDFCERNPPPNSNLSHRNSRPNFNLATDHHWPSHWTTKQPITNQTTITNPATDRPKLRSTPSPKSTT